MQLSIAKKSAFDLLKQEGLLQKGWRCEFDDAKHRLGCCKQDARIITLSRYYIALNPDETTEDTIKHEIAHALTPDDHEHGEAWKAEARRLGAMPEACAKNVVSPEGYFVGTCPNCARRNSKHRAPAKMGRIACGVCCKEQNEGNFDERFLYSWRNEKTGEIFKDGRWQKDAGGDNREVEISIAEAFAGAFGASAVIELKDIGKLPEFRFDDYDFRTTPEGVFRAFLEVKMWRKIKDYTVLRTFWRTVSGNGLTIDVWLNSFNDTYETADKRVNIEKIKVAQWYELIMMKTPKGFLRLQTAKVSK